MKRTVTARGAIVPFPASKPVAPTAASGVTMPAVQLWIAGEVMRMLTLVTGWLNEITIVFSTCLAV